MKILCVEDDINLGQLLKAKLVKDGYQVDLVEDGVAGWELAKKSSYNLILSNLLLPKIDGIQLCKLLRSDKLAEVSYNSNTPIILTTALDTVTYKVMGLQAGADDYMVKPLNLEELSARIKALLKKNNNSFFQSASWCELSLHSKRDQVSYNEQTIQSSKKETVEQDIWNNLESSFNQTSWSNKHESVLLSPTKSSRLRDRYSQVKSEHFLRSKNQNLCRQSTDVRLLDRVDDSNCASLQNIFYPLNLPPKVDNVNPELKELWQQCCKSYKERLFVIQKAVAALEEGKISPKQQYQAEAQAHTLTGSLGSFGLDKASEICCQIQQIFQQKRPFRKIHVKELKLLLIQLEHYFEPDESITSSAISPRLLI